jgi:hypothetical protein
MNPITLDKDLVIALKAMNYKFNLDFNTLYVEGHSSAKSGAFYKPKEDLGLIKIVEAFYPHSFYGKQNKTLMFSI